MQRSNSLDLILTNNIYTVEGIDYQEPLGLSDHISLLIGLKVTKFDQNTVPRKLFYKGDYISMIHYFTSIDWCILFMDKTTQECFDIFYGHFTLAVDRFIPSRAVKLMIRLMKYGLILKLKMQVRRRELPGI